MRILVIDIGGSHIKVFTRGQSEPVEIPSGRNMTPARMVSAVRQATRGWKFDAVSIGYPGRVGDDTPVEDAPNLGRGWVGFDFKREFKKPVKILNDAAMQALGSYKGGNMLFLGLGTGLGSTLILDGVVHPMELGDLPYREGGSYAQHLSKAGLKNLGKTEWVRHVKVAIKQLKEALQVDYLVLGGGQAELVSKLPKGVLRGDNSKALDGGLLVWKRFGARKRLKFKFV